ncbi:hypothetical protein QQ056_17570 [Oscillatoria laete-virens NRMC-F 0139]|nr:hypothetical protein [Oscillatoria laete-virens]MDL5055344.1 hypothetical protein [Oscillatoria laete-virens NRMC-F 0139]
MSTIHPEVKAAMDKLVSAFSLPRDQFHSREDLIDLMMQVILYTDPSDMEMLGQPHLAHDTAAILRLMKKSPNYSLGALKYDLSRVREAHAVLRKHILAPDRKELQNRRRERFLAIVNRVKSETKCDFRTAWNNTRQSHPLLIRSPRQ